MKIFLTACCCLAMITAHAQPGITEMQQARQELNSSFFSALDVALVLSSILGTFGALRIFHNAQIGKDRLDADVATWFFAALFITLVGAFLRAIFGI